MINSLSKMLEPLKHVLACKRIILASSSPRRNEILQNVGLKFEVVGSTFEENLSPSSYSNPADFVIDTAFHKVMEVSERLKLDPIYPDIVIGADTSVTMDGHIYGKPKDEEDAYKMLESFSGRSHIVYTGVVIKTQKSLVKFHESTEVWLTKLAPDVIKSYIKTGEPMDKAGGYGIQGIGGTIIEKIDGDYFNVMGFPLHHFCRKLSEILVTDR